MCRVKQRLGERGRLGHQVKQGRIGERNWTSRQCRVKRQMIGERRGGETQEQLKVNCCKWMKLREKVEQRAQKREQRRS